MDEHEQSIFFGLNMISQANIRIQCSSIEEYQINRDLKLCPSWIQRVFDPFVIMDKHPLVKKCLDNCSVVVLFLTIGIGRAFSLLLTSLMNAVCPYATDDALFMCNFLSFTGSTLIALSFLIHCLDGIIALRFAEQDMVMKQMFSK